MKLALKKSLSILLSIQDLGQNLMQLLMEINVVLHKVVGAVPQRIHTVIKAKSCQMKNLECAREPV